MLASSNVRASHLAQEQLNAVNVGARQSQRYVPSEDGARGRGYVKGSKIGTHLQHACPASIPEAAMADDVILTSANALSGRTCRW
jgi:hypothetical protein